MHRTRACDIFRIAAAQVRKDLHLALAMVRMPNRQEAYLKDARDQLHRSCTLFEESNAADDHYDLYLPLFDSLGIVTSGIARKMPAREIATYVFACLEDVGQKAVCV